LNYQIYFGLQLKNRASSEARQNAGKVGISSEPSRAR